MWERGEDRACVRESVCERGRERESVTGGESVCERGRESV